MRTLQEWKNPTEPQSVPTPEGKMKPFDEWKTINEEFEDEPGPSDEVGPTPANMSKIRQVIDPKMEMDDELGELYGKLKSQVIRPFAKMVGENVSEQEIWMHLIPAAAEAMLGRTSEDMPVPMMLRQLGYKGMELSRLSSMLEGVRIKRPLITMMRTKLGGLLEELEEKYGPHDAIKKFITIAERVVSGQGMGATSVGRLESAGLPSWKTFNEMGAVPTGTPPVDPGATPAPAQNATPTGSTTDQRELGQHGVKSRVAMQGLMQALGNMNPQHIRAIMQKIQTVMGQEGDGELAVPMNVMIKGLTALADENEQQTQAQPQPQAQSQPQNPNQPQMGRNTVTNQNPTPTGAAPGIQQ